MVRIFFFHYTLSQDSLKICWLADENVVVPYKNDSGNWMLILSIKKKKKLVVTSYKYYKTNAFSKYGL